ncbi:MAG TPA: GGDEF domain-containing protein [Pirellulaceae bacterium]|jgi:diguanylate cyclase (GGDEF)-like protein|nr:GGDEF domain-containing protein [Pirellulaceae bacterium]
MWLQFFLILNGGLLAGAVFAAAMRFALNWAVALDRRAALAEQPTARARSNSHSAPVSLNAAPAVAEAPFASPGGETPAEPQAFAPPEAALIPELETPDLDLPEEWLETLAAQGIVARSCFEAVVHILRLEVGAYRDALCTIEDRLRTTRANDVSKLRSTFDDASSVIGIWHERQETALTILRRAESEEAQSPQHDAVARMLQFQVDRHAEVLQQLSGGVSRRDGAEMRELGSASVRECLTMVHRLRDWVMNELAKMLREQGRLADLPERAALDGATSIFNRVGVERSFAEWQGVNPNGDRPAALAIIHVDEFDRVNSLLGTRAAELALRAFAELGKSLLRRNRGFDCVGRAGGVDLIVILGDTPPKQAVAVVERMRQTIEESEFCAGPLTFALTVSACVGDCDVKQSLGVQIERVSKNVRTAALRFGRNRTFCEGERGVEEVEAPPLAIKPKSVILGAEIEIKDKGVDST